VVQTGVYYQLRSTRERGERAHVIIGVGEDDGPRVSDPFVELSLATPLVLQGYCTHPNLTDGSIGLSRQP
jgi:hypothetical protein